MHWCMVMVDVARTESGGSRDDARHAAATTATTGLRVVLRARRRSRLASAQLKKKKKRVSGRPCVLRVGDLPPSVGAAADERRLD